MSTERKLPEIGETVRITSEGHQQDGKSGTVVYHSEFMGTVGVELGGHNYGFFPSELIREVTA